MESKGISEFERRADPVAPMMQHVSRRPIERPHLKGPVAGIVKGALSVALAMGLAQGSASAGERGKLSLETMGAHSFAGTVLTDATGRSVHCDHGYAEFFIPKAARKLPIVMWHSSSTKTWQTTFDDREGWQPQFLRRGYPVYLIDLPRQGRASWGCEPPTERATIGRDQTSFEGFRFGTWTPPGDPVFFPGVQADLSDTGALLNEVLRTRYPELNGPAEEQFESDAVKVLLNDSVGRAILMGHSGSSRRTMWTALKTRKVAGIVAVEGSQIFPEGHAPEGAVTVPESEFIKLTKIPILIILGDYLDISPNGQAAIANARAFVEAVNSRGGKAELLYLPERGIRGNTHFSMSDLNSRQVAGFVADFFRKHHLDRRHRGHKPDSHHHYGHHRHYAGN